MNFILCYLVVFHKSSYLFQLYIPNGDKGKAKRLHGVIGLLVVEDHSMSGQIESPIFVTVKFRLAQSRKGHQDIVAK